MDLIKIPTLWPGFLRTKNILFRVSFFIIDTRAFFFFFANDHCNASQDVLYFRMVIAFRPPSFPLVLPLFVFVRPLERIIIFILGGLHDQSAVVIASIQLPDIPLTCAEQYVARGQRRSKVAHSKIYRSPAWARGIIFNPSSSISSFARQICKTGNTVVAGYFQDIKKLIGQRAGSQTNTSRFTAVSRNSIFRSTTAIRYILIDPGHMHLFLQKDLQYILTKRIIVSDTYIKYLTDFI